MSRTYPLLSAAGEGIALGAPDPIERVGWGCKSRGGASGAVAANWNVNGVSPDGVVGGRPGVGHVGLVGDGGLAESLLGFHCRRRCCLVVVVGIC